MGINFFKRDDRDAKFVLFEHMGVEKLLEYEAFSEFSTDDFNMILEEGLKVAREAIAPTLQDSDQIGLTYDKGEVRVPESFHECWKVLAENGWMSMCMNPEFGGQGLPTVMHGQVMEFFNAANMTMQIYHGLAIGAGHLIESFGTEEDKALFVEKMYNGTWGGTMCLTEPDAGSDVGELRAKAVPDPSSGDPRIYKIQGNKRFISSGEHNLTENIIHLVLARIEGAPEGTRGVSLFIVPKIWVNPDGTLGEPNDTYCENIEHKMGIHGSSTCSLLFGENNNCRGILLGEPHSGMPKMFQMMNEARIGTGSLAHGAACAAYDVVRTYSKDRVQGPLFTNRKGPRVPVIQHEDVRRMLMNLKSGTEAMRAMIAKCYFMMDVARHDPDPAKRESADDLVELLTPLVKAYCSDFAYELARDAIQAMGGVGYCREFPVEQLARDIKSASIYEGTSYIQSLDLIGRKMAMKGGKVFQGWLESVLAFTGENKDDADFAQDFKLLFKAAQAVGDYAMKFMQYFGDGRAQLIPLAATRYLECMAEVFMATLMLEQGLIARDKLKDVDPDSANGIFYHGKIQTVHYFCRNILTRVFARHLAFQQEDLSAVQIREEAF